MSSKSPAKAPDFSDATTKLQRANHHIADLNARIDSFLHTDFYQLLDVDQKEGRWQLILESLHQPDAATNAVLGDAIGNLRSTLDYIVGALVYPITCKHDQVGFPFADNEAGFKGQVKSRLGDCADRIQHYFIDQVQAYKAGLGKDLWALNKLRNIDKHRLLVATAEIAGVTASWRDVQGNVFTNCGIGIAAGGKGCFIEAPADFIEFTDEPRPTFDISIEEEETDIIAGQDVRSFLESASRSAQHMIDAFKEGV